MFIEIGDRYINVSNILFVNIKAGKSVHIYSVGNFSDEPDIVFHEEDAVLFRTIWEKVVDIRGKAYIE